MKTDTATDATVVPTRHSTLRDRFRQFAQTMAKASGSPIAFTAGVIIIAVWGISGPVFHYSEDWQLLVNTGTTIITFLMVFIIQNTQARDSKEIHLKLDELLRAVENARNAIIDCSNLSDDELEAAEVELRKLDCGPAKVSGVS